MAKWVKGQSGNPKGMPPGAHHIGRPKDEVREIARQNSAAVMERLVKMALGSPIQQVITDQGETIDVPASAPTQVKAGEVVLSYDLGKPHQSVELTGADGQPLELLPTEGLQLLAKLISGGAQEGGPERI